MRRPPFLWIYCFLLCGSLVSGLALDGSADTRQRLDQGWNLQSSVLVRESGESISKPEYQLQGWLQTSVPTTVLNALVQRGIYPDPRFALNAFRLPDASDEFNEKQHLTQYSHLPGKRNPWTDPWWFRKSFDLKALKTGEHTWLHLDSVNYRAEVWLNGHRVARRDEVVSMNQRFAFDVTPFVQAGSNTLAIEVWRVDHVGPPGTQLVPLAKDRFEDHISDAPMDYAVQMAGGYDCFPPIPDRYTGILQDVWIETTGPVVLRDPFVVTELPLPQTDRATLKISATLVNSSDRPVTAVLRGTVSDTTVRFETTVALDPGQSRLVTVDPWPIVKNPKLWWPNGYGEHPLYDLNLQTLVGTQISHQQQVRFGVRQVSCEMHELNGHYGRRILINGQKVFARGGYIQPDMLLDWTAERMEQEVRYYASANLDLIYFEDIANPPDFLLDMCDRYGVMFGQCFYGCSWMQTGSKYPADIPLVQKCTRDILRRYRNHPSLVMYMASNEGFTREEVYRPWRESVIELDGSRFWVPSNGMPNTTPDKVQPWFRDDLPAGMSDNGGNSYGWEEPSEWYRRVREVPNWMFMVESGSASVPPLSSLARFIPGFGEQTPGPLFPLDATWAHHGANKYYQPYDAAVRRIYGEPKTVGEYVWQAHLATADQHRAMFEAVNHRLWDVTSGFTEWKINSAWPDVQWQIFDWFLKPMVSYYYIKKANEPLHVQLGLIEPTVTVVNKSLQSTNGLHVRARVMDSALRVLNEQQAHVDIPPNCYREAFELPKLPNLPAVYFVRLDITDAAGKPVADNFYWFPAQKDGSMVSLHDLPPVKLESHFKIQRRGSTTLAKVTVTNPSNRLAFLVQLALTKGAGGAEILPVLWDDNYFSLLPGESKEIGVQFNPRDAGGAEPTLEVGGWNIAGNYACTELMASQQDIRVGQQVTINATAAKTFLDGSRVVLLQDGKIAESRWAWARNGSEDHLAFPMTFNHAGTHVLESGGQKLTLNVRP